MHHQIHMDHPGNCPICGMKLVPVYTSPPAPLLNLERGAEGGVRISPERQQLIGLKTAKVERKPAVREIRTTGRAAFDPDLAVAQREYLEISKNVPSLKEAARSNLRLKGMSEEEIRELDLGATRRVAPTDLYLPKTNDPIWIYATLFQDEMDLVQTGDAAAVSLPSDPSVSLEGTVKSVDPVVDAMTRSVRARILLPNAGDKIRPNTYVNVTLKSDLGEALLVPSSAVLDSGERRIAFVRSGDRFEMRAVATGPKVGEDVVIKSGLNEGEEVVTGAAFLVDSESQLKAALP
jgi:Cu(I)/Ag(I) efflux system membrane fusion protein